MAHITRRRFLQATGSAVAVGALGRHRLVHAAVAGEVEGVGGAGVVVVAQPRAVELGAAAVPAHLAHGAQAGGVLGRAARAAVLTGAGHAVLAVGAQAVGVLAAAQLLGGGVGTALAIALFPNTSRVPD